MLKSATRFLFAGYLLGAILVVTACAHGGHRHSDHDSNHGADRLGSESGARVMSGLEVLARDGFKPLQGKRVGLIVNHSSIDSQGRHSIDLINGAPGIELTALFSPEHGIRGTEDRHVDSSVDEKTGVTIHSLYGKTRTPTAETLENVDVLVFDIQDIGARFYTYIATMGNCMNAAKEHGVEFVVLDRPNPIRGDWFDGPVQDEDLVGKFTAFVPMPTVHGMTVGEIANFFHQYYDTGDEPIVVPMEGWSRELYFDETGLPWVNPSPNMRSVNQELLYTMVALTESNKIVSVGRGTERPFEYLGAPWVDGAELTEAMRARDLPGLWFMNETFMPRKLDVSGRENYPYQYTEEVCHGFRVVVTDRHKVSPVVAGVHMLDVLLELYPEKYSVDKLRGLVGAQWVLDEVKADTDPNLIAAKWRADPRFREFAEMRESVLMY